MICVKWDIWSVLSTAKEELEIKTHWVSPSGLCEQLVTGKHETPRQAGHECVGGMAWRHQTRQVLCHQTKPVSILRYKSAAAVSGDEIHWPRGVTVLTALTAVRWIWRVPVALGSTLSPWCEILLSFFWRYLPHFEKSHFPAFICDPWETAAGLLK